MKKIYLAIVGLLFGSMAYSQYYYLPYLNAAQNPGNLNNDGEYPVGGGLAASWTSVLNPSATPAWSAPQTIPFSFNFNGNPETQFIISNSGILTFTTSATTAPGFTASALPSANIPDKSVCVWGIQGTGTNDIVVQKVFGTAPNRQLWLMFSSYTKGANYTYFSIVLEETSNKIYIVDQRHSATITGLTLGVQVNSTTASQVQGSPNASSVAGTDAFAGDNSYYEFNVGTQNTTDMKGVSLSVPKYLVLGNAPFNITGVLQNFGTATVSSLTLNYKVNSGSVVSGSPTSSVNVPMFGNYTFTHPTTWTPSAVGTYTIEAWATNINGNADQNTSNDMVSIQVEVVDTFVNRKTCMEVFTSSTCGPCVAGNQNMDNNVVPNLDVNDYTIIKYQQDFPGAGDPYKTTESVNRRGYYGINSIPRMEMDGQWDQNAASLSVANFNSYQDVPSFMTIDITKAQHRNDSVNIEATILPYVNYGAGTYRYQVVINEKKTTGNIASNGETEFFHVMMDMIPSETGTPITALTKNVPINISQKVRMKPGTFVEDMGDLQVVVFVQNNTDKKILQSNWKDIALLQTVGLSKIDENGNGILSIYPNPSQNIVNVKYQTNESSMVNIIVRDMMGKEVFQTTQSSNNGVNVQQINTSDLSNGIYFVTLNSGDTSFTQKIVVKK